jgi:hypothetical protein
MEVKVEASRLHHTILEQLGERGVIELERAGVIHPLLGTLTLPAVGKWALLAAAAMAQGIAEMIPNSTLRVATEIAFGKFPPGLIDEIDRES